MAPFLQSEINPERRDSSASATDYPNPKDQQSRLLLLPSGKVVLHSVTNGK
jgi:hypothetical protein